MTFGNYLLGVFDIIVKPLIIGGGAFLLGIITNEGIKAIRKKMTYRRL